MVSVLIVDDHGPFRASARRLLETEGVAVVGEAANGQKAIGAARQLQPEMGLLDVQPAGHGVRTTARPSPCAWVRSQGRAFGGRSHGFTSWRRAVTPGQGSLLTAALLAMRPKKRSSEPETPNF